MCPWVRPATCSLCRLLFLMTRWSKTAMMCTFYTFFLIHDITNNCLTLPQYWTSRAQYSLFCSLNSWAPWTWTWTCWPLNFPSHTWTAATRPGWWTPDSVYLHLPACHFFLSADPASLGQGCVIATTWIVFTEVCGQSCLKEGMRISLWNRANLLLRSAALTV